MAAERTYSYAELADRIEQVLGQRPAMSSLRAAAAEARRTSTSSAKPRLTAGLPRPRPTSSRTAPAAFSRREVEAWLRHHPRRAWAAAYQALVAAAAKPQPRLEVAVGRARAAGLSWRQIAQAVSEGSGVPHSRSWVHKTFRDSERAVG